MKVIEGLQRAIQALNMKPNFRLNDGGKSYDLLSELDKVKARQAATRYEARIVENEEGSYYVLLNEQGEAVEGEDFETVKAEAIATLDERGYLPEPRLVIAEVLTTYIKVSETA